MSDKRENVFGLTPLPGGGYAEYAWDGLSYSMRAALESASAGSSEYWLPIGSSATMAALSRRGITEKSCARKLTEDGKALVEWMNNIERKK